MIIREGNKELRKLGEIRSKIADLQVRIKEIERAPLASSDIRMRIRAALENKLKRSDAQSIIGTFSYQQVDGNNPSFNDLDFGMLIMVVGIETVEQRMVDLATQKITDAGQEHGMPLGERKARAVELRTEIRELERAEIVEMARLEDAGHDVLPRLAQDPALMLEVWGELGGGSAETGDADADLHRAPV